jgi:hypothetical protein
MNYLPYVPLNTMHTENCRKIYTYVHTLGVVLHVTQCLYERRKETWGIKKTLRCIFYVTWE